MSPLFHRSYPLSPYLTPKNLLKFILPLKSYLRFTLSLVSNFLLVVKPTLTLTFMEMQFQTTFSPAKKSSAHLHTSPTLLLLLLLLHHPTLILLLHLYLFLSIILLNSVNALPLYFTPLHSLTHNFYSVLLS